jgi:hypothetical protein
MSIAAQYVQERPWTLKRIVTPGVIGNVLEWYETEIG